MRTVGVAGGSFNYTILVPEAPGVGAVGIYILEIQLGALYFPARSWLPIVYRNKSCQEFIESVRRENDLVINGIQI
jgi:hypothetical protein